MHIDINEIHNDIEEEINKEEINEEEINDFMTKMKEEINKEEINKEEKNEEKKKENNIHFIIDIANNIFVELGKGFIEGIYHKAMLVDLHKYDYKIESEKIIPIEYRNVNVGYIKADIILEDENNIIIIELKSFDRNISQKEKLQINKYKKHIINNKNKRIECIIINFNQKTHEIDYFIL